MKENQEDLRANFIEQLCWCFKNFRGSFQEESICIFLILIRFALESLVQFFCAFASQLLTTLRVFSHVDLCTSFWKEDGDGERNERREGTFAEAQVLLNR